MTNPAAPYQTAVTANHLLRARRCPRVHAQRHAELAALFALCAVATGISFFPHWDADAGEFRPYPVHMDEYVHWGYAEGIIEARSINLRDPFTGQTGATDELQQIFRESLHERGFQALVGATADAAGVRTETLFLWGPAAIAVLLVLGGYAVGSLWNAGLASAACMLFLPTSLRFLGPAFFVPVALGLPLFVLGLFLIFRRGHTRNAIALFLVAGALFTIHFAVAVVLAGVILISGIIHLREPQRAFPLLVVALLPTLVSGRLVTQRTSSDIPELPAQLADALVFGPWPVVAAGAGVFLLAAASDRRARAAGVTLGVALVAAGAYIIFRVEEGKDPWQAYDRLTLLFLVLAAFPAGHALTSAVKRARAISHPRFGGRTAGVVLSIVIGISLAGVAFAGVEEMASQPRYAMLTDAQYDAYTQAAKALRPHHRLALVEGISTMPFSILTGRPTLFVATPDQVQPPEDIRDFFAGNAADTYFLLMKGVTVVVTDRVVTNPDLHTVAPGVYVLREDYALLLDAVASRASTDPARND